jgi:hypothetical protein
MLRAMRLAAIALAVVTFAACKHRASEPAAAAPDLAPSSLTCATIQRCVSACPPGTALPACADACVARLTPAARPFYDALQACVAPRCAADAGAPCLDPASLGCKLCAMSHCGGLASSCLLH